MTTRPRQHDRARLMAGGTVVCVLLAAGITLAQTPSAPPASAAAQPRAAASPTHPASSLHPASGPRSSKSAAAPRPGPTWRDLSAGQQRSLAPLAAQWDTLNEAQKRKWIALSANFPKMAPEEQAKLHSRMTEWVSLSPQQRAIARLNYGETQKLSPGDKKAQWEAYQALSPEEKSKLAARASAPKPPATAAAIKPVPREKLAVLPKARQNHEAKAPRIAAAPNQVDHNTLLPQPVTPSGASVVPPQPRPQPQAQPAPQPAAAAALPPQAGTPD